jgi:hypothetical protein
MKTKILILAFIACCSVQAFAQTKTSEPKTTVCDNLLRTNQLEAALQCYIQALQDYESSPQINLRVCQILEALGRADQMEPYFSRLDKNSPDAIAFVDMITQNYGPLTITCLGDIGCPFFFTGKTDISFTPPEDIEQPKAKRLAYINEGLKGGKLSFLKQSPDEASTIIPYFPVVTGAPLPYVANIAGKESEVDFNFASRSGLQIIPRDLGNILCGVPDTMAELQVEIDDPEFQASLKPIPSTSQIITEGGRYYAKLGETAAVEFQRKGRPSINKKYVVATSLVLTSIMVLLQR